MTRTITLDQLTKVLAPHFGPSYWPGQFDVLIFGESPRAIAEKVFEQADELPAPPPDHHYAIPHRCPEDCPAGTPTMRVMTSAGVPSS